MTADPLRLTVNEASRLFQTIKGNSVSRMISTPVRVRIYPAETFGEFLLKNKIETYERVVR